MIKRLMVYGTLIGSLLIASVAWAVQDPIQLLEQVSGNVMSELRANRGAIQGNPDRIYSVVDHLILPHADFVEMSKWVIGRNAWQAADSRAQQTFVEEFKRLVVRSYARSLLNYTDQTIQFLPLRTSPEGKDRIEVSSIIRDNGRSIRMNYRLIRWGNSWKVYDIIVEGVSLMQGYRAQFSDAVRRGGLSAAIDKIQQRSVQRVRGF